MRLTIAIAALLAVVLVVSGEQQRVLRRVIKSTPTANQLTRVRLVTVRSASAEPGVVAQISSKEAASFGQRSSNDTRQIASPATKTKQIPVASSTTTVASTTPALQQPSTTTTTTTTSITTAAPAPTTQVPEKPKANERQQVSPNEVEILSLAPSSWQMMTAVEAPAAALIAAGTRLSAQQNDLATASTGDNSQSDFLRSSASSTKGSSYTSTGETFSRIRQQQQQTNKQSFFYPKQQPQQQVASGKTSNYQATKTHWYQPSTTPRPAPIVQEPQYEQYVEQQQQEKVEYGAAPAGQAEPFAFDFKTQDNSGNGQYRKEESNSDGVVRGSYGYTDANGIYRHVEYIADQNGFRANIKSNEPGLIGETQPASIKLDGGARPARVSAASNSGDNSGDWSSSSNYNNNESGPADSAVAPPDFESSHRAERLRSPRQFNN